MQLDEYQVCGIFAPKLRILTITEGGVEISRASESSDGCQMMVFGDNLKHFDYVGEFLNECCFYNSFSLNNAEIHVCEYPFKRLRRTAYRFYKLLRGLSSVKHLLFVIICLRYVCFSFIDYNCLFI